jgi:RNA polymerase sigma-70 factor, ECF subfamily
VDNDPDTILAHMTGLRRYAMALVRNSTDAEDLVQECVCRAIERAQPWRKINDMRSYLFTILHNLYVDKIVKKGRRQEIVSDEIIERKLIAAPVQMDRLALRDLSRALDGLSPEQRDVVLLIGLEGLTYEAAAKVVGVPVGTIMSRLSRAREALRQATDGRVDPPVPRVKRAKLDKSNGYRFSGREMAIEARNRG